MNRDIIEKIDDRLEKRFESYAQVQQQLHQDFHDKLLLAVENKIDTKVNGKIDALKKDVGEIKTQMNAQDVQLVEIQANNVEVKGILEERKFVAQLWTFIKFLGGVVVSIGSAIILYNNLKQ